MGIRDRLTQVEQRRSLVNESSKPVQEQKNVEKSVKAKDVAKNSTFVEIKKRCQKRAADDEAFYQADSSETRQELRPRLEGLVREVAHEMRYPLSELEVRQLALDLLDEIYGLGPIEPLLADGSISDILINGFDQIYVERGGKLELTDVTFISEEHLRNKVDRMLFTTGRRVDESSPLVDARLPDGSRINIIIPPLAVDGICVSIRRFPEYHLRAKDLISLGSMTEQMFKFLEMSVRSGLNIIVCGGTGSGKTTTLNMLSGLIPFDERTVTIEDSAELRMQQAHVVRLETRPPNAEGIGEVTQRELLKNALRMRPDRIVLGEVRGGEVLDMLQAMNTGHDGSLATLHANSPRDCIARLELMINLSGVDIPANSIRKQIASALDLIIYVNRGKDGKRRVESITEVTGVEEDNVVLQELFLFESSYDELSSRVLGRFKASGVRPSCAAKFESHGMRLSPDLFSFVQEIS
ncbi:type II/IV secretion system-related protein [Thiosulfatimonas sediminis]|uniref:Type II/IV secretion system-related protein n=1 Tax=Thiosulfatimonas sediminis TaxID=2675054 RepID=A0A6F8PXF5_9GAMM|nr:CpaF family protein [Thiosulfatimonas sediminis]BBP46650.1 type II/IV secretion system-related protein [Thiosulfatimonas sediminis]